MFKLRNDQSGAASLLTVIFLSILLSMMTLAFVRLAVNEQRAATDDDLTTRAYYAAESGVEDAKRALREYQATGNAANLNGEVCAPPTGYNSTLSSVDDYSMEYTCQLIDVTPFSYRADLTTANQIVQIPLNPIDTTGASSSFDRIRIQWHINSAGGTGDGLTPAAGGNVALRGLGAANINVPDWNAGHFPAMLRVNFFSYNKGGFNRADINNSQYITFLNPSSAGSVNAGDVSSRAGDAVVQDVRCDLGVNEGGSSYVCEAIISGFNTAARAYYLRLTPLFVGTHIKVEMLGAGSIAQDFSNVQAVIDVTGRAGDVYRRTETAVDLNQASIFPDNAVTSALEICKNFTITDDIATYGGLPNSSCR